MKDPALEQVWQSRRAIAKKCGDDPRRLIKYLRQRGKSRKAEPVAAPARHSAPLHAGR